MFTNNLFDFVYCGVGIPLLIYVLYRLRKNRKSANAEASLDEKKIQNDNQESSTPSKVNENIELQNSIPWWNQEDFPYDAPWWFRYPLSMSVFAGSYCAIYIWNNKVGWLVGAFLILFGLLLIREVFVGALIAGFVGIILWSTGAAVAALPVSVAIIIGAMIIAQAIRR